MEEELPVEEGAAASEAAPMPDEGDESEGLPAFGQEQQVTPEEQELYNLFVSQAWNIVYDDKVFSRIIQMLKGGGNPVDGLVQTAVSIISRVFTSGRSAGRRFTGDVVHHASKEILEDLAELSRKAGIRDYSKTPDELDAAYLRMIDELRVMAQEAGLINQQTVQADFAKIKDMDERGELDTALRGLAEKDRQGKRTADAEKEEAAEDEEAESEEGEEPTPKGGGLFAAAGLDKQKKQPPQQQRGGM